MWGWRHDPGVRAAAVEIARAIRMRARAEATLELKRDAAVGRAAPSRGRGDKDVPVSSPAAPVVETPAEEISHDARVAGSDRGSVCGGGLRCCARRVGAGLQPFVLRGPAGRARVLPGAESRAQAGVEARGGNVLVSLQTEAEYLQPRGTYGAKAAAPAFRQGCASFDSGSGRQVDALCVFIT